MRTNAAIVSTIGTATKAMMEKKSDHGTLVEVTKSTILEWSITPGDNTWVVATPCPKFDILMIPCYSILLLLEKLNC
jgi:hypothetical protein